MTKIYITDEEAIVAAKKQIGEFDLIGFDGQNCNDYKDENFCDGWDGHDNRCSCGNRRVYWETYGDKEQGFTAFACAN